MLVVRKLSTDTLHIVKDRYNTYCGANYFRVENGFHMVQELSNMHYKPRVDCKKCLSSYPKVRNKEGL